jgi:integrase
MSSSGTIYKRGETYWIKYYKNGKPYYESSRSDKKMVAKKLLDHRVGEIADGKIPGIHFDRVKFDELAEDFLADYRINQRKSLERAEISIRHLQEMFKGVRATEITTTSIRAYVEERSGAGAANGTINRELAALKRILNIGAKSTPPKVDRVPHIPMLKEGNARKGFFEHGDFTALRDALPDYLRGVVTFGYKSGWRKSEILGLEWSQVDTAQGTVTLDPGTTKNDQARMIYLDEELQEVFRQQWEDRKRSGRLSPYVFPNEAGTDRIKDFRGAWETSCKNAELGDKLFHDLRRTAVRNMVRAGIPERVAMMVSGHQTRSVFERYNIVSDDDLRMAAAKQQVYLEGQMVTKTVTVANFGKKKGSDQNG